MSREQANTFKKYKEADDSMGNLGWASKMSKKAIKQAVEAPDDIESSFSFTTKEKLVWRLVKIARRYTDVETCGILPAEQMRGVLRGLVAADVLDIMEGAQGKALVPLEIKRLKRDLDGKGAPAKGPVKKKAIHERVFRPEIGLSGDGEPEPAKAPAAPPPAAASAPAAEKEAPTADAKKVLKGKDWELKKKIDGAFTAMADQDHYAFLGVKRDASESQVKEAGLKLAREYHPDVLAGSALAEDDELKGKLDALFGRLQDARGTLGSAEKRADYDKSLDAGGHQPAQTGGKVRRPQEAQLAFAKAETFFKKKDYRHAEKHYKLAVEFDDQDPKLQVALAWCIYLNEAHPKAERHDKAFKKLVSVIDKHRYGDAAYRLAMIARLEGKEAEAQKRIREAVRLDPKHVDAQREKRIADRRANKAKDDDKKSGGVFGKFLKK